MYIQTYMYTYILLHAYIHTILWVLELDTLCSYFAGRRHYFVIKSHLPTVTKEKGCLSEDTYYTEHTHTHTHKHNINP